MSGDGTLWADDPAAASLAADLGRALAAPTPRPDVELRVYGMPAPQGSKRPVRSGGDGGRVRMVEQSKRLAPWRQDVSAAVQAFADTSQSRAGNDVENDAASPLWTPLDGPLVACMVFTLPKPAGAPKRRRTWPQAAPDLSKLLRSTEDALTTAGLWRDDARVVEYVRAAKVFPGEDPDALRSPGALIRVWTMSRWRAHAQD